MRKFYASEPEAKRAMSKIEREIRAHGTEGARMRPEHARDARRALRLLAPHGRTLTEAAALLVRQLEAEEASVTWEALVASYLEKRPKSATMRGRTVMDYHAVGKRFAPEFGGRPVSSIHTGEVAAALHRLGAGSQAGQRRYLRALFNYAIDRGWARENPAIKAEVAAPERGGEIPTLTNGSVSALLKAAEASPEASSAVPYAALGIFAGVRPAEIARLGWGDIYLDEGQIVVRSSASKTRSRRVVEVQPKLAKLLRPFAGSGPVIRVKPAVFRRLWEDVRERAGLFVRGAGKAANRKLWPEDVMRHTFASNHLAAFGDVRGLEIQLGHRGGTEVLFAHYHEPKRRGEALKFWGMDPGKNPA